MLKTITGSSRDRKKAEAELALGNPRPLRTLQRFWPAFQTFCEGKIGGSVEQAELRIAKVAGSRSLVQWRVVATCFGPTRLRKRLFSVIKSLLRLD